MLTAALTCLMLASADGGWQPVAPGVEYRALTLPEVRLPLHVVRVTPQQASLRFKLASESDRQPRTAAEWMGSGGGVAAINAGMYEEDGLSNTGRLHCGAHVNQARWKKEYQSALAFGPKDASLPAFVMVDLDQAGAREQLARYDCVVQNLRLIKAPGAGVWKPNGQSWSEAAAALDDQGRLLLLFSRSPQEMAEYTRRLLATDLHVVRAMHLDGSGPAELSVRLPGQALHLAGGGDSTDDVNSARAQRPVPNVLVVVPGTR